MTPFEDWLFLGMAETNPPEEIPRELLATYFIRFNREIARIREDWQDDELARGIWYLYGSGACHFSELHRLPPSPLVDDLFESVHVLYRDLFEARCSRFYSHLDCGPDVMAQPLNGPCYMLWEMTCGIDCFWHSGVAEHVQLSIRTLESLGRSSHPAVVESVIHGLGHMIGSHREACQPVLEEIMSRKALPVELRSYAHDAIYHYIQ
jgi:hypothetical protein